MGKRSGLWIGVSLGVFGCSVEAAPAVQVEEAEPIAEQSEALSRSALPATQAKQALKLIDDICGDTWCEGDYDFGFRRLTCSALTQTCTLTLQIFPRDGVDTASRSYWRSCKTSGFTGFTSLVSTTPSGYQSLQNEYYDALSECVSQIEAKLR